MRNIHYKYLGIAKSVSCQMVYTSWMANTKAVGNLGEEVAARFLESKGFAILERNYRTRFGEIDIVARKGSVTHIVEVKSVSRENPGYRPEELVHAKKLAKLRHLAEFYAISHETSGLEIQIDVIAVRLDYQSRRARCTLIEHAES